MLRASRVQRPAHRKAQSNSNGHAGNFSIHWSERAAEQVGFLRSEFKIDLKIPAERVLARDAAPHPYRRISKTKTSSLQLAIKSWRLEFAISGTDVEIQR